METRPTVCNLERDKERSIVGRLGVASKGVRCRFLQAFIPLIVVCAKCLCADTGQTTENGQGSKTQDVMCPRGTT